MAFVLGKASAQKLATVHPRLRQVVELAIKLSSVDFTVLEGARTVQRQHELYGQGRTAAQLKAAGVHPNLAKPRDKQVTWTLKSNHFPKADGLGRAVDLAPWPIDWEGPTRFPKFDAIADAMFAAARQLGIKIRWGADWDMDGNPRERGETDSPHFELAE